MTLPTTVTQNTPGFGSFILQYGNQVTIFPFDQINRLEVWRAPDNGSGAPNDGAAVQATVLPPSPLGGVTFIDMLPNDGAARYYKCRHIDDAGNVSVFTMYTEAMTPELVAGAAAPAPVAAFGAIVDQLPPSSLYEIRFASNYSDPDVADGMQSYIDFPATTNFMRIGQTPKAIVDSTFATPIVLKVVAHGLSTGDKVTVRGHLTNTPANGTYTVTAGDTDATLDADHFALQGAVGTAIGSATGHVVRLSLTIDGAGNLVVYAIIRAVSLIVSGVATFNGLIQSVAGALFRTLQHSTTGSYNDTNMKRVMLQSDNVETYGDVSASKDGDGDGTKLAALIGSHTVIGTGTPTARASKDVGLTAGSKGWQDPHTGGDDVSDDGINTLTVARGGNSTTSAANRLWCKLGDPTSEGDNVDAYDDRYTLTFRVQTIFTDSGHDSECDATVTIEYATDAAFAVWTALSGAYLVANTGTGTITQTFNPTVTVPGAPSHVAFRLKLNVATAGLAGTPSGTGKVLCFASTYRTDNYAVTWSSLGSGTYARRGLKLPKMKQAQMLKNPGVELGASFWAQINGTVSYPTDAAKAHSGSRYIQIVTSGATFGTAHQSPDGSATANFYPVTPGDVVTFGGWAYRESGTSALYFVIDTYDAAKAAITSSLTATVTAAAWTQVTSTYTVPAGTAYVVFKAEINNVTATTGRFDDMSLVIGTDDLPHTYLEPLDAVTADTKAAEGEIEYVGSTQHGLAFRDDEKMRFVSRTIGFDLAGSTTNIGDTRMNQLGLKVKAGKLNVLGRRLKIRCGGSIANNTGAVHLRLGPLNTVVDSEFLALTLAANEKWVFDIELVIQTPGSSGTARVSGITVHGTTIALINSTFTLNTTGDLFVTVSGSTAGGVTQVMDLVTVDHSIF